ncbi:MAG: putative membrane protein [Halieaceae bacterium]|jgi:putative membrane protein
MELLRKLLALLVILTMLVLGVLFAVQNTHTVPLDLLVITLPERSVALWVLLAFAAGSVIGMLASAGIVLRLRKNLYTTRGQLKRKNSELDKLRSSDLKAGG